MKSTNGYTMRRSPRAACSAKRAAGLLCLLLVCALLPVSGLASTVPTEMRVALVSPQDLALYPLRLNDRDLISLLGLVYESVMELDDTRTPVPMLADSYRVLPDGKTYIFTIRGGVRFHNGFEMTAYDIVATMDAIKSLSAENIPANEKGQYHLLTEYAASWKADDAYTLTVTAKRASYELLYAMTFPVLQSQAIYEANPPGTGPYRVADFSPGREIWLVGNQGYYGKIPYISEITGVWYSNIDDALRAFESNDVDIVMTRSPTALRYRNTASGRINAYNYSTRQLECLLMNHGQRSNHLNQLEMRQAVTAAINKSRLVTNVYSNMVTPTNTLQSPASWLYYEGESNQKLAYSYDPDKANALLDQLGWDTYNERGYRQRRNDSGDMVELEMRMYYYNESDNGMRGEAANEIAEMLRAVGIRVKISSFTFEAGAGKLSNGDYDLFMCAYNFDAVPDPGFMLLSSSNEGNYARYRSDDMNNLIRDLRSAGDAQAFQLAWQAIQVKALEDVALMPLYWRNGVMLTEYPFSSVRDIREYELLKSINNYQ